MSNLPRIKLIGGPSSSGTAGGTEPAGRSPSGFFARLTIQGKLVLSFGLLLLLVAVVAVGGLLGLRAVRRSYEAAMDHGLSVERLAGEVRNELLEARRSEKDFLLNRRKTSPQEAKRRYLQPHGDRVRRIRRLVAELRAGGSPPIPSQAAARIDEDLVALAPYITVYQQDFNAAVDLLGQLAVAEDELVALARAIEDTVTSVRGARDLQAFWRQAASYRASQGDARARAELIASAAGLRGRPPRRARAAARGARADAGALNRYVAALDRVVAIERATEANAGGFSAGRDRRRTAGARHCHHRARHRGG